MLNVSIQMEIIEKFYFGYISDLAVAKYIIDITRGVNNIVINLSEFIPYREKLEEFSNRKDMPKFAQNTIIQIFSVPDQIENIGKMTLYGRKK